MTTERRFEQQLPGALADLAMTPYPAYIDEVLEITAELPRRPAWQFPSRWLPLAPRPRRLSPALVILLLLLAALIAAYVGSQQRRLPPPFGPADNGEIAFPTQGELWIVTRDGTTRMLYDGPGNELGPEYSHDGTRIAFMQVLAGLEYLWVVDADGSNARQVVAGPLRRPGRFLWSPDDTELVVASIVNGTYRIQIARTDGSGARFLDLDFPARAMVWRPPDGRELAVRGEVDGQAQIFIVAADGSSVRQVGPPSPGLFHVAGWDYQGLSWSPDGSILAYNGIDGAPGARGYRAGPDETDNIRFQIHVIEPDGTDRVIGGPDIDVMESWADWSPDGKLLAIERWQWEGRSWIAIIPADGSGPGLDVDVPTVWDPELGWRITWAPDGTRILANRDFQRPPYSIDVGTGLFTQVPWQITEGAPSWQRIATE